MATYMMLFRAPGHRFHRLINSLYDYADQPELDYYRCRPDYRGFVLRPNMYRQCKAESIILYSQPAGFDPNEDLCVDWDSDDIVRSIEDDCLDPGWSLYVILGLSEWRQVGQIVPAIPKRR